MLCMNSPVQNPLPVEGNLSEVALIGDKYQGALEPAELIAKQW